MSVLVLIASLILVAGPRDHAAPSDSSTVARRIAAEYREFSDSLVRARPLWATWTVEPQSSRDAREVRMLAWLRMLDAAGAPDPASPNGLLHLGLREGFARQLAVNVCRDELWSVSPLRGMHLAVSATLNGSGRDSVQIVRQIERLRALPSAFSEQRRLLDSGRAAGYTAARDNVDRVIEQLDMLLGETRSPNELPFVRSIQWPVVQAEAKSILLDSVAPALSAYRAYLAESYRPVSRIDGSLRSLPDGVACYRARLALITGVQTPPESLAAVAAQRLRETNAELAPILVRLVGDVPLEEAKRRLRGEARFLHSTREEMLTEARAIESRLTPAISRLFNSPPTVPLVIEQTPAVMERSDPPARYLPPSAPGEPGRFLLNTYRPDSQPRWNLAIAVAHEGSPGHHFERTYPRRVEVPMEARSFGIGSYAEGWGIYAEELAVRESGVLDDDLAHAGLLMHYIDAWNGLELDIMMHLEGWSRERVIERTMQATGKSRAIAALYADRHASTPGQLASYMAGYLSIRRMRDEATRTLGSRFNLGEFHERYLEAGPLPLPIVHARIQKWISDVQSHATPSRVDARLQ